MRRRSLLSLAIASVFAPRLPDALAAPLSDEITLPDWFTRDAIAAGAVSAAYMPEPCYAPLDGLRFRLMELSVVDHRVDPPRSIYDAAFVEHLRSTTVFDYLDLANPPAMP